MINANVTVSANGVSVTGNWGAQSQNALTYTNLWGFLKPGDDDGLSGVREPLAPKPGPPVLSISLEM